MAAGDRCWRLAAGIREISDEPDCIFRLASTRVRGAHRLADGTRLERGEVVGALHLASERVPLLTARGGDLAWGKRLLRQLDLSLRCLARSAEGDQRRLRAYGNTLALPYGESSFRVLARLGFEVMPAEPAQGWLGRMTTEWQRVWALMLRRAYNPASGEGLVLRDLEVRQVWISRATLIRHHGSRRAGNADRPASP